MAEKLKWSRDFEYERIAHERLAEAMQRLPWLEATFNGAGLPQGYRYGDLRALVGREPVSPVGKEPDDFRWHVSVNGPGRLPDWYEMVEAAHQLRPGVCFVIGVPPRSWWMADLESGKYVLHLWQLRDENLERNWMAQRTPGGRAPS